MEGCRWHRGGVEARLAPRWRGAVGTVEGWRCGWRRGGGRLSARPIHLSTVALAAPPPFRPSTRRQAALHRAMRRIKKERSPVDCHQRPVMGFFRVFIMIAVAPSMRLAPRWRGAAGTVEWWRCGWRRSGVRLSARPIHLSTVALATPPPFHAASSRTPQRTRVRFI